MSLNFIAHLVMRWHSVPECFTNVVAVERLSLFLFCPLPVYWIPCFHQNGEWGRKYYKTSVSFVNKQWVAWFLTDLELGPMDRGWVSLFHGPVAAILNILLESFCRLSLGNPCLKDNFPLTFCKPKLQQFLNIWLLGIIVHKLILCMSWLVIDI